MDKLNITSTKLAGAYIITPNSHSDERGSFSRVFCKEEMGEIFNGSLNQINHSITKTRGTVRGLHFQYPPDAEVKMVKCIRGRVFDVIVDIRSGSETFMQWHGEVLGSENTKMIYIPEGFAHGFQTMEDDTELLYFHSDFYTPNNEGALNTTDPILKIEWPLDIIGLSDRDANHSMIDNKFVGIEI